METAIKVLVRFRLAFNTSLAVLSVAFSVIGAGSVFLASQYAGQPAEKQILSSALASIAILSLIWVAYRTFVSGRKERYANITVKYRSIFARLSDMTIDLSNVNQSKTYTADTLKLASEAITTILDDLSSVYSMITGTRCRAAVKVVQSDGSKVWVHTLARDRVSTDENRIADEDRAIRKFDELNQNEDFEILFNKQKIDKGYYFNNNLLKKGNGYESTSLLYHQESSASARWTKDSSGWPLDYRSTIVWPIRGKGLGETPEETECVGFLAVDSESRGVFEQRWDSHIGSAIASSLYLPLNLYSLIDNELSTGGTDDNKIKA